MAAGKALQAMGFRWETIASIALAGGVSQAKVHEYLQVAAADARNEGEGDPGFVGEVVVAPMPTAAAGGANGQSGDSVVADAHRRVGLGRWACGARVVPWALERFSGTSSSGSCVAPLFSRGIPRSQTAPGHPDGAG